MSALPAGRLGDVCSHGAVLISGDPSRTVDNRPVVRLGDLVACPLRGHGVNPIIAVQAVVATAGRPTGHLAAIARCGAVLVAGSATLVSG